MPKKCVFHFRLDGTVLLDVSPKPELQNMNSYSQFKYYSVSPKFTLLYNMKSLLLDINIPLIWEGLSWVFQV